MDTLEYYYTNDLGRKKRLCVDINRTERGNFPYVIWDEARGEPCLSGEASKQDIVDFLAYYGITCDLSALN